MSEEETQRLWKKVQCIDRKLDDILTTLKDDQFGQPGLVTKVNYNKQEIRNIKENEVGKLRKQLDRIYWTVGIVAFAASLATAIVTVSI